MDNKSIQEMVDLLESDVIDDAEELLVWLGTDGVELLKELLLLRELVLDVAVAILDNTIPGDPCYDDKLVNKLNDKLKELHG